MIPYDRLAWFRLLFATRGTLERTVISRVILFGTLATIVWVADRFGHLPVRLPMGFHEIAGVVIGLVLAFRTNTAYARFWEGRTLWGGIVNASRNLARVMTVHGNLDAAASRDLRVWIVLFAHATKYRLRGVEGMPAAADLLSPTDCERLRASHHPAVFCAEEISRRIHQLKGSMDPIQAGVAEEQLVTLINCLGGCERILRTPTPLGYILLMERSVFLYLVTLPAALLARLGFLTPLVVIGVAYLVLMIETIGNELDNPFGMEASDIPLDRICDGITFDLLDVGRAPGIGTFSGVGKIQH